MLFRSENGFCRSALAKRIGVRPHGCGACIGNIRGAGPAVSSRPDRAHRAVRRGRGARCVIRIRAAREFGLLSTAHVWGRPNRLVKDGYRTIAAEGLLGPDHNIAHGNCIEDDELKILVDSGASITSTAAGEMNNHIRRAGSRAR